MVAGRAALDTYRRVDKAICVIESSGGSLTPGQCFRLWLVITMRSKGARS
ncbi:MAG: hypothetical protein ACREQ5_00420 [Candidatus Dormibacteria bacterium]